LPEEPELIKRFFSTAFPNPDRAGCPDKTVLRSIAADTLPLDHHALSHVASCSPCYTEVEELTRQLRAQHRRRRRYQLVAAGIAGMAIIGALLWAAYNYGRTTEQASISKRTTPSVPSVQVPSSKQASPVPAKTPVNVPLDLRPIEPTRSVTPPKKIPAFAVPANLVNLQITLPLGSDDGSYELQIQPAAGGEILRSANGRATITRGDTRLDIVLDLSDIGPGSYTMFYRHLDASWHRVPLSITK
jgi:hypothetical protein